MNPTEPSSSWPAHAADTIDRFVGIVRDRATEPALKIIRAIVFGLVALVLLAAALVLVAIVVVRTLNLLPGGVWVADLITGGLFLLPGWLLWSKRTRSA